ncbi:MAG: hypothetical protein HY554_00715, partial [Elusimicrobia bacterium]|nr:hypothetical protein [Elusimicrobiota bacterium]
TDTGTYWPSSNALAWSTAGLERLRLDATGRAGIGTSAPAALLHVSSASASAADTVLLASSGTAAGQELLTVKGDGKIGIGTPVPGVSLDIAGDARSSGRVWLADGGPSAPSLTFTNDPNTGLYRKATDVIAAVANGQEALTLSGAQGIGTLSIGNVIPAAEKLLITGSGAVDFVRVSINNDEAGDALVLKRNRSLGVGAASPGARLHVSSAGAVANDVVFMVSSGVASGQSLFAVTGDGRVGAGSSDPPSRLTVVDGDVRIATTTGSRGIIFQDHTTLTTAAGANAWAASGSDIYSASGGNVGIGTTSPGGLGAGGSPGILHVHDAGTVGGTDFALLNLSAAHTGGDAVLGSLEFGSTGLSGGDKRTAMITSSKRDALGVNPTGDLQFWTANGASAAARLTIQPDGDVGIGTTSPSSRLDVKDGDIRISTTSGSRGIVFQDHTTLTTAAGANAWTASGANLYNAAGGNVGVGSTNPGYPLVVSRASADAYGPTVFPNSLVDVVNNDTTAGVAATFSAYVNGTRAQRGYLSFVDSGSGSSPHIVFQQRIGGATIAERMRIDKDGNVGIGTTDPGTFKLAVAGTGKFDGQLEIKSGSKVSLENPTGTTSVNLFNNGASGQYDFRVQAPWNSSPDANVRLAILEGGSVGIGTTNPAARLHVEQGSIVVGVASGNTQDILFRENGTNLVGFRYQGGASANPLDVYNYQLGTTLARIREDGKIGIGTTGPQARLEVRPAADEEYALWVSSQDASGLLRVGRLGDVLVGNPTSHDTTSAPDLLVEGNLIVDGAVIQHQGTGGSFATLSVSTGIGGTELFKVGAGTLTVLSGGSVGIGTTAPGSTMADPQSPVLDIVDANNTGAHTWVRIAGREDLASQKVTALWMHPSQIGNAGWLLGTNNAGDRLRLSYGSSGTSEYDAAAAAKDGASGITIDTSGNVGVGTTSPGYPLDVVANLIRIQHPSSGAWIGLDPGSGGSINWQAGANDLGYSIYDWTNGQYRLTVNNTGNVGVGTTSPNNGKLDVASSETSADATGLYVSHTGAVSGTGYGARILKTGASTANVGLSVSASGGTSNYAALFDGGNVGIGTANPAALLHIQSASPKIIARGDGTAQGYGALQGHRSGGTLASPSAVGNGSTLVGVEGYGYGGSSFALGSALYLHTTETWGVSQRGSNLSFWTVANGTTSQNERMRVEHNGNVGIGTTSPQQALEVNGGARLNTAAAKPSCDSTVRGTFWVVQGGAGVKDDVQVCAKDAGDAYAWRVLF